MFGTLISKFDARDYKITVDAQTFPATFELTDLPDVKNQRSISSCVAHVIAAIAEYFYYKEHGTKVRMSTDFIYGNQYTLTGRQGKGMYPRDACKILMKYGDCRWSVLPTNTEMPACIDKIEKLTDDELNGALEQRVKSYAKCSTDAAMKYALTKYGPLLGSISYNDKLAVNDDGVVTNVIKRGNKAHGVMIYGWNDIGWLCQNSWGTSWGNKGRFIIPFENEIKECWCFVDMIGNDVKVPKNNYALNKLYKAYNAVRNTIKKN